MNEDPIDEEQSDSVWKTHYKAILDKRHGKKLLSPEEHKSIVRSLASSSMGTRVSPSAFSRLKVDTPLVRMKPDRQPFVPKLKIGRCAMTPRKPASRRNIDSVRYSVQISPRDSTTVAETPTTTRPLTTLNFSILLPSAKPSFRGSTRSMATTPRSPLRRRNPKKKELFSLLQEIV